MASYNFKQNAPEKHKNNLPVKKIIGVILLAVSTIAFLSLFTGFLSFIKSFLMGIFGIFSYPLFIVSFCVGLALINNKKYVFSKLYILYVVMAIVSILSIIDLALMHGFSGTFGEYLSHSYTQKTTAGGLIIGLLTAVLRYLILEAGAFVINIIILIIFIALIIDYFYYAKNIKKYKAPVKIIPAINKQNDADNSIKEIEDKLNKNIIAEPVKITLDSQAQKMSEETTAKEMLGLLGKGVVAKSDNIDDEKPPIFERQNLSNEKPASLKEYLLTTPKDYDISYFRKNDNLVTGNNSKFSSEEIAKNINSLKNEQTAPPQKFIHDDFATFNDNFAENTGNYQSSFILSNQANNEQINNAETNHVAEEKPLDDDEIDRLENEVLEQINNTESIDLEKSTEITSDRDRSSRRGREYNSALFENKNQFSSSEQNSGDVSFVQKNVKKHMPYIVPSNEIFTTESVDPSTLSIDTETKRAELETVLETFGVPAKVINVVVGPAVSRFELEMPMGVSVKRITAHHDDIALALASNGDIRIEAPIPGRSAVGIEVPNKTIATVGMKELITSDKFNFTNASLPLILGKDLNGDLKICDLQKLTHLLIAGSTGSGKSVCLNAILISLIKKLSPDELRLVLIDPKRVEFSMYNNLPHLIMPKVITEPDKAVNALSWAINEMERRYMAFESTKCRNIGEYNSRIEVKNGTEPKMPFIVIIVDELADLMLVAKRDIEDKIARLAAKARAGGIHLVLATQRPSVDVITGTIKNNFPSRISFALTSFADSKTVLDQSGAEKLLGKGDMLYKPQDASSPYRIQGCFMTGTEVENFVNYVINENKDYDYDDSIAQAINNPKQSNVSELIDGKIDGDDDLIRDCLRVIIESGQASISMLQRRFSIGFNKAGRIITKLEQAGYISASDGSKPRSVYITLEDFNKMYGEE